MRIDFFEEYPTEENLRKAGLITWSATVYLAARSTTEFETMSIRLKEINPKLIAGYWPVLTESYWISPFADSRELEQLKRGIVPLSSGFPILLDMELPLLKPSLFLKNFFLVRRNKKLISELLKEAKVRGCEISTAEYSFAVGWTRWALRCLGVSYDMATFGHKRIIMYYTSMIRHMTLPIRALLHPFLKRQLIREAKRDASISFGLGTTAVGVLGNEPILTSKELEQDLQFVARAGVRRVTIFRLGGVTPEQISVLRKLVG